MVSQVLLHAAESGGQSEIFEQAKFVKENPISDSPTSYLTGIERSKCPEFAYSISRKIGKAAKRNQLRRRLRAIISQPDIEFPYAAYLITASRSSAGSGFQELYEDLRLASAYFSAKFQDPTLLAAPTNLATEF